MTDISLSVLIDEWLPVSPPAANATAAASYANDSNQIVASHPATLASGLSSPPAKAAGTGGSGATARKRRREALAGAGKQPKRPRGKKEKAPLTESTAATDGERMQVDVFNASDSDPCDRSESAPSSPTPSAFPRGGLTAQRKRGGDSASLAAQTPAPMNLESPRANRGAKQKTDVVVGQPLVKMLVQRRSLLPSPAPIFRQTLGELWSFLDPTFSASEPASSPEQQPTTSGRSQSFSLGQEATTSEPPTPSAQSCFQRGPADAAVAATDTAGANAAGSEGGAQTSGGSADAEEGSLDSVIGGGKRGASKAASMSASARARSGGGAITARQVAVLREAVAAAHTAGRAVVAPAGSSAADGGASMGQQGAGDGGKRRARRPFSRQGSSNAPHVAARDGKAAGARGAQREGADGAEVARGEAATPGRPLGSAATSAFASAAVPPPAAADLSASHADVSASQADLSACEAGAPPGSHAPAPLSPPPARPTSPPSPASSLPLAAPSLPSPISPPQPRPHMDGSSSKSLLAELSLESPALGPQAPSFESQLYELPNWSGSPDLSLQAHSMQSLWTDEGTSDLPLMPLACGGEQGSGVSPNLLPSLEWQTPSGLESREQVEVDWARLPDLDELPSPSPPFPNLDPSLTPRLPASLDGVASLAYCEQGGISTEWRPVQEQQQQPDPQEQEQQRQEEGLEEWTQPHGFEIISGNGDGRAEGVVEGGMGEGGVGAEAHEAVVSAVQRGMTDGGERWSAHDGGPLGEPGLPESAPMTQPCFLIGQSQPLQPMSAEEAASVAPMDFEAAASVAVSAELWDSPHTMNASGLEGMEGEEGGGGVWEELDVVVCGVNGVMGGAGEMEDGGEGARREWDLASVVRECTAACLSPTPPTTAPLAAIAPPQPPALTAPLACLPAAAASPPPSSGGSVGGSCARRALSCSSLSLARSRDPTRPPLDRTLSGRVLAAALQTQSQGAAHSPHRGRSGSSGNFGSGGSGGQGVKEQEGVVQLLSRVATVDWEEVRRPMSRAAQSIQCHWARRRLSSTKRWGDVPVLSLPDSSVSDGSLQEGASRVRGDGAGWGVGGDGGRGGVGAALSGVSDVSAGAGSCVKGV
ncbi:unnamed protein product [Closterium sp. Naga37s-1]|nr:unnamed protein product [Closterium sp. Naga37s-1]